MTIKQKLLLESYIKKQITKYKLNENNNKLLENILKKYCTKQLGDKDDPKDYSIKNYENYYSFSLYPHYLECELINNEVEIRFIGDGNRRYHFKTFSNPTDLKTLFETLN